MEFNDLRTPCYVVDEKKIEENLKILRGVSERTGVKILLAQKAFSMFYLYPLIGKYLDGTAASGLYEAKLGREEMGGETHIFSVAYRDDEFEEIAKICDHIVFNSFAQFEKFKNLAQGKSEGLYLLQYRQYCLLCWQYSSMPVFRSALRGGHITKQPKECLP
jgi:carboxynorspermidine decarboxylase